MTTRVLVGLVVLGALAVVAVLVPVPGPAQVRLWAEGLGALSVVAFFAAYAVCTAAPVPRTVFNLAAGLLFGDVVGISVALVATVLSGLLGFRLARSLGREVVLRHLHRKPVRALDDRLSGGGALAVASLRLIPVVPFAPLSYLCGVSALPTKPYLVGTAIGSVPGTVAVVVLGDALTGTTPPALVACYAGFAVLGALGLLRAVRSAEPKEVTAGKTVAGREETVSRTNGGDADPPGG
ncbi:TVP38/TMEM64 family protein [Saccharomonospora azurea]|uniref:TVP38/TMEM64 family protein n=1 Tax=Saccharomonospora azurea TaxID=40988 RepID=UPI00056CBB7C|nr:TVP38/TMEM64 family protein [Saccharomonospora azurea]